MLGIIFAIAAAFFWSIGSTIARVGLQSGIRTSTGTLISMVSSLLLLGTLALTIHFDDVMKVTLPVVLWFGLVGFTNYVMGRQFNYLAIKHVGVTRATPLNASSPFFSTVLAVSLLGESVTPGVLVGTLTIIGGVYLVVSSQ